MDQDFGIWVKLWSLRFWFGSDFGVRFLSLRFWVRSDFRIVCLLSLGVGVGSSI